MEPEEYEQFAIHTGALAYRMIGAEMDNPGWENLPKQERRRRMEAKFRMARSFVRKMMRAERVMNVTEAQ